MNERHTTGPEVYRCFADRSENIFQVDTAQGHSQGGRTFIRE